MSRVRADGKPTTALMDLEQFERNWFKSTVVDLDRRATVVETAIDEPGTGLKAKVERIDETVGDADSGLVQATSNVTLEVEAARAGKPSLNGRISDIATVVGDAGSGLVQAVAGVSGEVEAARGSFGSMGARFQNITGVLGDADSGLVQAFNAINLEVETARNGQSSLSQYLGVLDDAVGGVQIRYGVTGSINGVTGGFTLTGVETLNGGAAYGFEFTASSFRLYDPNLPGGGGQVFNYNTGLGAFEFSVPVIMNTGNLAENAVSKPLTYGFPVEQVIAQGTGSAWGTIPGPDASNMDFALDYPSIVMIRASGVFRMRMAQSKRTVLTVKLVVDGVHTYTMFTRDYLGASPNQIVDGSGYADPWLVLAAGPHNIRLTYEYQGFDSVSYGSILQNSTIFTVLLKR